MSKKLSVECADESERLVLEAALKAYRKAKGETDRAEYGRGMEVLDTALSNHGMECLRVMGEQLAVLNSKSKKKR